MRGEGEADGVGAEALDDVDGVDDVALGLGHLLAVGVADEAVDVDLSEGDGVGERALAAVGHGDVEGEVAAEHDHAGDPEEEDVEAGDEEAWWGRKLARSSVICEACRLASGVGPAEGGEGEQTGGEPGVEDVGFLHDVGGVAVAAGGGVVARDGDSAAGFAVPGGDAVAPPELAGDAPVVDVGHPLEVDLFVHLRGEVDGWFFAVDRFDCVDGVLRDGCCRRCWGFC